MAEEHVQNIVQQLPLPSLSAVGPESLPQDVLKSPNQKSAKQEPTPKQKCDILIELGYLKEGDISCLDEKSKKGWLCLCSFKGPTANEELAKHISRKKDLSGIRIPISQNGEEIQCPFKLPSAKLAYQHIFATCIEARQKVQKHWGAQKRMNESEARKRRALLGMTPLAEIDVKRFKMDDLDELEECSSPLLFLQYNTVNISAAQMGGPHVDNDGNPDPRDIRTIELCLTTLLTEQDRAVCNGEGLFNFPDRNSLIRGLTELRRRHPWLAHGHPSHPGGDVITSCVEVNYIDGQFRYYEWNIFFNI